MLKPGSHYATQRKQDFYANYAANDHYMGSSMQNEWPHRMTTVYARLAPGATAASAQAELRQIAASLHQAHPEAYPKSRGFDIVVTPWKDELTAKAKPTLVILLVTTVFVLIIACANVANLTLTRLVQREREMGIRAALGAPASMLRRQLLAENLVLSVLGGLLGLGLAVSGLNLLIAYTVAVHEPHRRDRPRRHGPRVHARRLDGDGAAVRVGAAPDVHERSGARDVGRRRPGDGRPRAAARAARARRQPAGGVVHAAHRRRPPDADAHGPVRRQARIRSRERAQPAGAQLRFQNQNPRGRAGCCSSTPTSSNASRPRPR